ASLAGQVTQLRPTHPPEPVVPVPQGTYADEPVIPINSSTWTNLGPAPILNGQRPGGGPVSGRLTGIAAHPSDPNTIYVTAAGGAFDRRTVSEIAVDPTNASIAYAAIADFAVNGLTGNTGIWKTVNGGTSWTNTTTAFTTFDPWSSVRVDPSNPSVVYAAAGN